MPGRDCGVWRDCTTAVLSVLAMTLRLLRNRLSTSGHFRFACPRPWRFVPVAEPERSCVTPSALIGYLRPLAGHDTGTSSAITRILSRLVVGAEVLEALGERRAVFVLLG